MSVRLEFAFFAAAPEEGTTNILFKVTSGSRQDAKNILENAGFKGLKRVEYGSKADHIRVIWRGHVEKPVATHIEQTVNSV